MKFIDMDTEEAFSLSDLKKDWETFRKEEPWNHAESFMVELYEIIMATINYRNNLEIIGTTPDETERFLKAIRKKEGWKS